MTKKSQRPVWGDVRGGAGVKSPAVVDATSEFGEPALVIGTPDFVRRPDTGEELRVVGAFQSYHCCPMCYVTEERQTLALEQSISVFWCRDCEMYVFYRERRTT